MNECLFLLCVHRMVSFCLTSFAYINEGFSRGVMCLRDIGRYMFALGMTRGSQRFWVYFNGEFWMLVQRKARGTHEICRCRKNLCHVLLTLNKFFLEETQYSKTGKGEYEATWINERRSKKAMVRTWTKDYVVQFQVNKGSKMTERKRRETFFSSLNGPLCCAGCHVK